METCLILEIHNSRICARKIGWSRLFFWFHRVSSAGRSGQLFRCPTREKRRDEIPKRYTKTITNPCFNQWMIRWSKTKFRDLFLNQFPSEIWCFKNWIKTSMSVTQCVSQCIVFERCRQFICSRLYLETLFGGFS